MPKANSRAERKTLEQQQGLLGPNLNFAGVEAYNLLRTNLNMCVMANEGCPVIGITSSVPGEGKSTTSINLAYAMVEDGKKVLLIELDMRLPAIAKRLGCQTAPGMSDLLVGHVDGSAVVQKTQLHPKLYMISAGTIPPNPSELIGSANMEKALKAFGRVFDYIILDLPPINLVSDALVVSKLTSGIALVVRRGFCRKRDLREAIRRLNMVEAKVFGLIETHARTHKKSYRKYGHGYGYGYGYGYGNNKSQKKEEASGSGKTES